MQRLFSAGIGGMLIVALLAACGGNDASAPNATATSAGRDATATLAPGSGGSSTATGDATGPTPTIATELPTATSTVVPPTATTAPAATVTSAPEPTATASQTAPPAGVTDAEARLLDLLLAQEELGEDWIETNRGVVEGDGSDGICGTPPFPRRNEKLAHVEAAWKTSDGTKLAFENVVEFPGDVVQDAMDYVQAAFNCSEWTDALGTVSTLAPWDDPTLGATGDDHQAAIVTIPSGGLMVDLYVLFVRTGNLITQLGYADVLADPATAAADAAAFVRIAIEKVEAGQ